MEEIFSYRFRYAGSTRHVDNVTWEGNTFIGFERRKSGKYSNKIKRYRISEAVGLQRIEPLTDRVGGSIARP